MILSLLLIGYGLGQAVAAPGCPFCPPTQPTFSEQLAEADVACLVKWVSATQTESDEVGTASTTFETIEAIRGGEPGFKPTATITIEFLRTGKPGDLFLLFGKRDEDDKIGWSAPVEVTELSYQYIRQAPPLEAAADVRLKYFLKFLEFPDPTIANDAFAEFSRARYEDVAQLAHALPREKIRRWLDNPETSKVRLGFYGLMLGLCGNSDDAQFLEDRIFAPVAPDDVRLGIDGMIGGFLLLRGEDGLRRIVEGKLQPSDTPRTDLFAMLNALRFAGEYCRDRLPIAHVRAAARQFLDRDDFAELVLPDLARWKDWSVLDRLVAQFGKEPFADDGGKLKIIQFAQACLKDRPADGETPPRIIAAKAFLERVESESPDLIRQTRRPLQTR
jgi:hypothetical protein